MAKQKGCARAPKINGELSTLYLDLFDLLRKNYGVDSVVARELTNLLYLTYKESKEVQDSLDNRNAPRNSQDEHSAQDVFDTIGGKELVKYTNVEALADLGVQEGILANRTTSVKFDTWQEAYAKSQGINDAHKESISSFVVETSNGYEVKVQPLSVKNELARLNTKIEFEQMKLIEHAMNSVNLDLSSISYDQNILFGRNYQNLVQWLRNTPKTNPKYLLKADLKRLVKLQESRPLVQRLLTKFGGVDALVDTYYDWYRGNYNATPSAQVQLEEGMNQLMSFNGLDTEALYQASQDLTKSITDNSSEKPIVDLYNQLNYEFKIGKQNIRINLKDLTSLTKLLQGSIKVLGDKLKYIKNQQGKTQEYYDLLGRVNILQQMLDQGAVSLNVVDVLQTIGTDMEEQLSYFNDPIPSTADLNYQLERGSHIRQAEQTLSRYDELVSQYSIIDTLEKDINISNEDAKSIAKVASDIRTTISNLKNTISKSKELWFRTTLGLLMPEKSPMSLDEVMDQLSADADLMDRVYDIATISHAPTAIVGAFIQKEADKRVYKLSQYQQRISAISQEIDHDSEFMYENVDGTYYIASDIDWKTYNKERRKQYGRLKNKGLNQYSLELAMDNWEKRHTEEVEVYHELDENGNKINIRYERFPIYKKAKAYDSDWSDTQKHAYKEFLKLKAEIESVFPVYAQGLYTPPQVRKSSADKFFSGNIKGALAEQWKKRFNIREDTQGYGQIESEDDVNIVRTDITGESTNVVPIHYINKLRNQEDLFKNMSAGLLHLASTAVNYESMSRIQDTVEEMDRFINDRPTEKGTASKQSGIRQGDTTYSSPVKGSKRRSAQILDTYKKRMLYNNDMASDSIGWRMFANTLSEATSVAALTFNVFGAINNRLEGIQQGLIEATTWGPNKTMNLEDFLWGWSVMWGNNVLSVLPGDLQTKDGKLACGNFWKDMFSGRPSTVYGLLLQRVDPKKDEFDEILKTQFRNSKLRAAIAKSDLKFILYSFGESLNNIPLVLGMARHKKVLLNGKEKHLTDVLTRIENSDGTYSLGIMDGVTDLDGNQIDFEKYMDQLSAEVGTVSERLNGGMSKQVQGEISSTVAGAALLKLRQWMIGVGQDAFRPDSINWRTGERRTGMLPGVYRTSLKPVFSAAAQLREASNGTPWGENWGKSLKLYTKLVMDNYKNLSDADKQAVHRFFVRTCFMTVLGTLVDIMLITGFKSHKDDEWFKVIFYLLKRRYKDSQFHGAPDLRHIARWGQTATTLVDLTKSPYAHANLIGDLLYPVTHMEDYGRTIERGVNKDKDRYLTNWSRKWIFPLKLYDRFRGLKDTDDLINSLGGVTGSYSMKKEYESLTGEKVKDDKKSKKKPII